MFRWMILLVCSLIAIVGWTNYSTQEEVLLTPTVATPAQKINPFVQQWVNDCFAQIGDLIKENNIPGTAVTMVYKDQVFLRTFGVRSVNTRQPVDEHTVFRIASLSKSMASVLTARLVREKRLHWNNYVVDYLPEFQLADAQQTQRIQLRHLLSHTTGLPYHTYTNLVEASIPTKDIIPKLKTVKLVGPEGTVYSYQNASFSVIGEVHRVATGQSYETLLQEKIFNPLGMADASMTQASMLNGKNVALPHRATKSGWHETSVSKKYYTAVPAGGINASIHDMATYLRLLLGQFPGILTSADLAPIFTPVIKTPVKRRYFSNWPKLQQANYGLGWRILNYNGKKLAYHSGFVNHYKGEMAVDHGQDIAFCLMMNGAGKNAKRSVPIFMDTYEEYRARIEQWEMEQ